MVFIASEIWQVRDQRQTWSCRSNCEQKQTQRDARPAQGPPAGNCSGQWQGVERGAHSVALHPKPLFYLCLWLSLASKRHFANYKMFGVTTNYFRTKNVS